MRATIAKRFDFDAAHSLPLVPEWHKCRRLHGHTYVVELRCEGKVRADGMVVDYAEIAEAWEPLHEALDHRHLNAVDELENPTTEVLAAWLMKRLPDFITSVRVHESATTWCEVTR